MHIGHRLAIGVLYGFAIWVFLRLSESRDSYGWLVMLAIAVFGLTGVTHAGINRVVARRAVRNPA